MPGPKTQLTDEQRKYLQELIDSLVVCRRRLLEVYELTTSATLDNCLGPVMMALQHLGPFIDATYDLEKPAQNFIDTITKGAKDEP